MYANRLVRRVLDLIHILNRYIAAGVCTMFDIEGMYTIPRHDAGGAVYQTIATGECCQKTAHQRYSQSL